MVRCIYFCVFISLFCRCAVHYVLFWQDERNCAILQFILKGEGK